MKKARYRPWSGRNGVIHPVPDDPSPVACIAIKDWTIVAFSAGIAPATRSFRAMCRASGLTAAAVSLDTR